MNGKTEKKCVNCTYWEEEKCHYDPNSISKEYDDWCRHFDLKFENIPI